MGSMSKTNTALLYSGIAIVVLMCLVLACTLSSRGRLYFSSFLAICCCIGRNSRVAHHRQEVQLN
ncbi:hypothetical protein BVRB_2g038770 [Beta vulgaris subsp. vulgaris]|nr:hypothetical protein BVRB_2g038770 [Beta vulgaris subsp. vulgaris]